MDKDLMNGTILNKNNSLDFGINQTSGGSEWTTINHLWIYTSPLILIFGICGNILTLLVMRRKRMRGTSTSVYLTILAIGDMTVVIIGLTPEWLSQLHIVDLWNVHPWVCKTELYMYYTSLDFAIWMLVAFSCDRFVAVCFPLKKNVYCTVRRALWTSVIAFAIANLNMHVFWTRGAAFNNRTQEVENCRYLPGYVHFELAIRPPIVFVAAFLIPCIVIGIWNMMIIVRVTSAKALRKQTVRQEANAQRIRKGLTQTTAMCVSTSIAFVVLVLPNIILFIGKKNWESYDSYHIAKAISSQLVYIHHSINFVLYSLTGTRFRRELKFLCGCGPEGDGNGALQNRSRASYKYTSSVRSQHPDIRHSPQLRSGRNSRAYSPGISMKNMKEKNHNEYKF